MYVASSLEAVVYKGDSFSCYVFSTTESLWSSVKNIKQNCGSFSAIRFPMVKIRCSHDHLILMMGIPMLMKIILTWSSGVYFSLKILSYLYKNSHYKNKMVSLLSYLYNGNHNKNLHSWKDGLYVEMSKHALTMWNKIPHFTLQWCHISIRTSQITGNLTVYARRHKRKHQSSASLALCAGKPQSLVTDRLPPQLSPPLYIAISYQRSFFLIWGQERWWPQQWWSCCILISSDCEGNHL